VDYVDVRRMFVVTVCGTNCLKFSALWPNNFMSYSPPLDCSLAAGPWEMGLIVRTIHIFWEKKEKRERCKL
jgi:hypothetical protein